MLQLLMIVLGVLRKIIATSVILLFAYMIGAIFVQILGRYVFYYPIAATAETATFALIWLVLLGAGIAMQRRMHVGIDMLVVLLPIWAQRVVVGVGVLLALWFLWLLVQGGLQLVQIGWNQRSAVMQWRNSFIYLALPVGALYFALEFILYAAERLTQAKPSSVPAEAAEIGELK
ncbi:TRAP transporter small permease [Devosia sp.]|uniref:TRAP transporter small permease n=1 Tax=Devosia sp. TaxID=1871048 RepID=UPI002F01896D